MSDERPERKEHRTFSDRRSSARQPTRGDTIVARATAPGRAAIAVVRVSGPAAVELGRALVHPWPSAPRVATRCSIRRTGHEQIDDGLAVFFPGPRSYTGEDLLEIHCHGGPYVVTAVESELVALGARPAEPGEFTERAVLNGRLDLIRAEAIGALIDARTHAAHRVAMQGLSGTLTTQFAALRADLIALDALIAYDIDFPEEDHGPVPRERVLTAAAALRERIATLLVTAPMSGIAREGAIVVLAGPPNAGKSSLLNALTGTARAIVSEEPGTTRDAIEMFVDGDPWPIRLIDTAGVRDATNAVERLGIEVSERYLRAADVVVVCAEDEAQEADVHARLVQFTSGALVRVRTKADLRPARADESAIPVSSRTGEGVDRLRMAIMDAVSARMGGSIGEAPVIATARQRAALERADDEVRSFAEAWQAGEIPGAVAATHLRSAEAALDHLIGAIDTDAVLAEVFATFCVGK